MTCFKNSQEIEKRQEKQQDDNLQVSMLFDLKVLITKHFSGGLFFI